MYMRVCVCVRELLSSLWWRCAAGLPCSWADDSSSAVTCTSDRSPSDAATGRPASRASAGHEHAPASCGQRYRWYVPPARVTDRLRTPHHRHVRGTTEGERGLISQHVHSQLARCNPSFHFHNFYVSVPTGFVLVGQKNYNNIFNCFISTLGSIDPEG